MGFIVKFVQTKFAPNLLDIHRPPYYHRIVTISSIEWHNYCRHDIKIRIKSV